MIYLLSKLIQEDSGQDLIEYALIASLIALGSVAAEKSLYNTIANALNAVGTSLTNAVA